MRLLLTMLLLVSSSNSDTGELKVPGSIAVNMHSVDDYWAYVPLEDLSESARAEIRQGAVSRRSDVVSVSGTYHLHSDFVGNGVVLMSHLVIVGPDEDSSFAMSEMHRGALLGITRKGGKHRKLSCPENWVDECYFEVVGRTEGESLGNILFVRRGRAIYSVSLSGLGGFQDAGEIQRFLGAKALAALEYRPNPEELKSAIEASATKANREE